MPPAKTILIEDHASGTALQQNLKRDGYTVIPIKPKGDKVMRMRAHTATLEAGKVFLRKDAPWLDELRARCWPSRTANMTTRSMP